LILKGRKETQGFGDEGLAREKGKRETFQ